jgi:hypothetical protein
VASVPVLQFAKFICPSLELFDGEPCATIEPDFDEAQLLGLLIEGSEQRLRRFLVESNPSPIVWAEPQFVEFTDEDRQSPLGGLQLRIQAIEGRIPDQMRGGQVGALLSLSPVPKQKEHPEMRVLRQDIAELKQQITQIAQLIYVHDSALRGVWSQNSPYASRLCKNGKVNLTL